MKIGIITLPFNNNYGGVLQAYALQSALRRQGHEVITIYRHNPIMPFHIRVLSSLNRLFKSIRSRKSMVIRSWATTREELIIEGHINRFIRENISTTPLFKNERDFAGLSVYGFDAYIVGSDQVWRSKYSPSLRNHFFGFINDADKTRRISYAASFGVENWEFTQGQTRECSKLVSMFNAVSVREDSAVQLCKENLGIDAVQVLDPTMLIEKEEYISLVERDKIAPCNGTLLTYVLDKSPAKQEFIRQVETAKNLKSVSIMPKLLFRDAGIKKIADTIYPPVTEWIRGFMDAEYVITDSYHGMVFAIIFNKPFLALGNTKRGMARFLSLLRLFNLEERMAISTDEKLMDKLLTPIDFDRVNMILKIKKEESLLFLKNSLK